MILNLIFLWYTLIVVGGIMKNSEKIRVATYILLRVFVIATIVRQIYLWNLEGAFLGFLTLLLFTIPSFANKRFNIELPKTLEVVVLLFIFGGTILGELNEFYLRIDNWDTILHTINGFIMAGIGFAMVDILNSNDHTHINLSPRYVIVTAICFSMTIGILWEFGEYAADQHFGWDMQKDTVITEINSVMLNSKGKNEVASIEIESLYVNGEDWMKLYGGYIDVGLHDTMKDLLVNFLGAVIFSFFGYFYLIGKNNFAIKFIPKLKDKKMS